MMPSEIRFPTLTSGTFVNQTPNKFMAAVFRFVHPVEKDG